MIWILGLIGAASLAILGILFWRWLIRTIKSEHENELSAKSLESQKKKLGKFSDNLQKLKEEQGRIRVPSPSMSWDDIERMRAKKGPINFKSLSKGVDKTVDKL